MKLQSGEILGNISKIEFLEEEIRNIEYEVTELIQCEYNSTGLDKPISEYKMGRLRGYMFMKDRLENELRDEVDSKEDSEV